MEELMALSNQAWVLYREIKEREAAWDAAERAAKQEQYAQIWSRIDSLLTAFSARPATSATAMKSMTEHVDEMEQKLVDLPPRPESI